MKENSKIVEDYSINRFTMVILPGENRTCSEILEREEDFIVQKRPIEIIDQSCRYFGSSYSGRKDGTKELMRITHKPPIVIDPANSIYFFPTTSSSRQQCAWISHVYVKNYSKAEHNTTIITFTNDKQIILPISIGSFEKQYYRTAQLRTMITTRIEEERRKLNMLLMPKNDKEVNAIFKQIIREFNSRFTLDD